MKKKMNFASIDALKNAEKVINEAGLALKDPKRTIVNSPISEILSGALGAGIGGIISFAALYAGGTVVGLSAAGITSGLAAAGTIIGGGMVSGIFVLAAPVAILGMGGLYYAKTVRDRQLRQEKERLYQEALRKHAAIINELRKDIDLTKERADYLQSLNIILQRIIQELKEDLSRK